MNRALGLLVGAAVVLGGCAAPMQTKTTSFPAPGTIANHQDVNGLVVAAIPIASKAASTAMFGTDMAQSGLLPVQIVAENRGKHEFEINAAQAFAVDASGNLQPPDTLAEAAQTIRASSIGTTAASDAFLGALAGAAVGAGIGAGVGSASGNTGSGAGAGAIIGGTAGAATGMAAGTSDSITARYVEELGAVSWGDQVLEPGDIKHGLIFVRRGNYQALRLKLFDVTANSYTTVKLGLSD